MSAEDCQSQMADMSAELASAGANFVSSRFWEWLNRCNIEQLTRAGFDNFKRTVNQNYYNWIPEGFGDNQARRLIDYWSKEPGPIPLKVVLDRPDLLEGFFRNNPFSSDDYCKFYSFFVGMLWQHAAKHDLSGIAAKLEEPEFGNPIRTLLEGRRISQDLANSLREYNAIGTLASGLNSARTYAEIGAGYGRLAHPFLIGGNCRYLIFDIPPALTLSQWYLTKIFPDKRIFKFRRFDRFSDISRELMEADVAFFTANQLAKFPDGYVDCVISISSLHEMTFSQIKYYLGEISRIGRSSVYFKQWKKWRNEVDGITVESKDFIMPSPWRIVMDRVDAVQDMFQEQGFARP